MSWRVIASWLRRVRHRRGVLAKPATVCGEKPGWMTELEPKLAALREDQLAIREILFLYRQTTDYCGICGDHHTGDFDPWRWLDCTADGEWRSDDDALLLRQGAAVALLSELMDVWEQGGRWPLETWSTALHAGRFDQLPEARRAVEAGLTGPDDMEPYLAVVYDEYVIAYFEILAREGRPGHGRSLLKPGRPRTSFRDRR